ncbi:MAG: site-specific integrase [Lachnospiraceae bacterium]|nr:site-specific integrase [Lachnospiraceae bacterium]MBQ9607875.1 site-specific integrase [Lachnospiraceae bacterium]
MSKVNVKGITRTKDGRYYARFTSRQDGKRIGRRFDGLSEAKLWLEESKYNDRHKGVVINKSMTVNSWFNQWIAILDDILKPKTVFNYTNYYNNNIKAVIGEMQIADVKPMHCMAVLQNMNKSYKSSSIKQTRVAMSCMFQYAVDNDIILKNPVGKSVIVPSDASEIVKSERHLLISQDEINAFFEYAEGTVYYLPCRLVLETGLRAGELIGLTWDEIDFENECIHIRHTMQYDKNKGWYFISPKSKQGIRDIYMTVKCREILEEAKRICELRHFAVNSDFNNLVFLSSRGLPIRNNSYDTGIASICRKADIEVFSLHSLRHTFASKCVMAGVSTKVLQIIMGHSDISTTMNIYVHITEDIKKSEIKKLGSID